MQATNYINGQWMAATSGETFVRENPSDTRQITGTYGQSSMDDVRAATDAASNAFGAWKRLSGDGRAQFLWRLYDAIAQRKDEFAATIVREMGKTLPEAKGETARTLAIIRYYAGDCLQPSGDLLPSVNPNVHFYSERLPIGAAGLVTPWNFPIAIPIWKAAPCLAYGNTVVLKPSEMSPGTAHLLAEAVHAAEFPHGVFNLIQGGGLTGKALVESESIALVSFTGSAKTGKSIARACVERGAKYQLEMGGKNPVIVLGDADLTQAVELVVQGAFKMAGQKCTATARVIVEQSIADEFTARLVERAKAVKTGDPLSDSYLGPVINEVSRTRILQTVKEAVGAGANLLCGGESLTGDGLEHGHFFAPTILSNILPDSSMAQDEVFGPVLGLFVASDFDHALMLANGVNYGLSASIFTKSLNHAMKFAREIEAGLCRVNGETAGVEPQAPFGGMKGSSSFSREQGQAAKEFYTQMKTVAWEPSAG